jgi:3-hydroxyisobutyrate dehydrogenase
MFGGSQELLIRCKPVLDAVGSLVIHVGGPGAGHAMKALNNLLSAIGLAAATEVIEVGRRFGLDPTIMLKVLNTSTGRNNATETKMAQFVLSRSFASGFALKLMVKDVAIALSLAHAEGISVPISEACGALWTRAAGVLPVDADHTMIAIMAEVKVETNA